MTLPDCMMLDGADPCRGYHELKFDLAETLKAVLYLYGPDGAEKITRHVMLARRARDSNAEIDKLEELFGAIT